MSEKCRRCYVEIEFIDGAGWVPMDPATTAFGLTYCPPDPDHTPTGVHIPARRAARDSALSRAQNG